MKYTRGKLVRRFEENIFGNQKYDRLLKRKQNLARYRKRGRRPSDFANQLTQKQKLKFTYGLREKQFRKLFEQSKKMPGVAGHNFLQLLERRLDNVIYQSGMGTTRRQSRQFVSHGHFMLNGKKVDIPSISVREGDEVMVIARKSTAEMVRKILSHNSDRVIPDWLAVSTDELKIVVNALPSRNQITTTEEEQLIVEYYSR